MTLDLNLYFFLVQINNTEIQLNLDLFIENSPS